MRVLHGINDHVNDPGFLQLAKTLELCSSKHIDCDLCPENEACIKYYNRFCTGCDNKGFHMKQEQVDIRLAKLKRIGVTL